MGMYKLFGKLSNEAVEELKNRIDEEKKEAQEKDISQFDFKMKLSKITYQAVIAALVFGVFMLFKAGAKSFIYDENAGQKPSMNTGMLVIGAVLIILALAVALTVKLKPLPKVRCSYLYYKGNEYHYSKIQCIKISAINTARVFLEDGNSFRISRDFENYDMFIVWAEKCGIIIERKEEL